MALLTTQQKDELCADFMRTRENIAGATYLKADLRAAFDAADQWYEDNAASFNSALPTAYRTNAGLKQKTLLFAALILKKAGLI